MTHSLCSQGVNTTPNNGHFQFGIQSKREKKHAFNTVLCVLLSPMHRAKRCETCLRHSDTCEVQWGKDSSHSPCSPKQRVKKVWNPSHTLRQGERRAYVWRALRLQPDMGGIWMRYGCDISLKYDFGCGVPYILDLIQLGHICCQQETGCDWGSVEMWKEEIGLRSWKHLSGSWQRYF